ncbi:MAG: YciI family protein [Devosia sp.]|uniref:YciI family protein n=1 Tax=Devosia sp. TaxID=1871048 RepID=UPI002631C972|nr:YciI family protein [Devosia sp.]MDB5538761.1 YciI family protein [Devosia sp.]
MRYMLMLYADEKVGAQIPPDQMKQAMDTMFAYQDALTKAGAFVMTAPLARTPDARTLRMEGGEITRHEGDKDKYFVTEGGELKVHDGPYADTREQFGGFYIIEARDMDEALDWAARCPAAQWGPIEVRALVPGF